MSRDRRSTHTLTFPPTKTWVDTTILLVACWTTGVLSLEVGLFVGRLFIFWWYGVL